MQTAPQRLYLTADRSRVVPESDPAARFLWKATGDDITVQEEQQYDLKTVFHPPADNKARMPRRNTKADGQSEA
jgi:hypothetical protein